jgi:DNA-binding transcriptional MerR regulator
MSKKHKFDVGDVVRINHGSFKENDGTLATVKAVRQTDGSPYDVLKLETIGGWRLEVLEYMVVGVPLEEVQRYYADKPRRGFIVDGLTVDELESGQDEAYKTFRTAAIEAKREELLREKEELETEAREIRAKLKRQKARTILDLIATVCVSVCLLAGFISLLAEGKIAAGVGLIGTIYIGVYAVCYEAGCLSGIRDALKSIDSKLKRNDNEDDGIT